MLTYEEITKSEAIKTYIIRADESLGAKEPVFLLMPWPLP